jgi:hypothetical protein
VQSTHAYEVKQDTLFNSIGTICTGAYLAQKGC